jgi:hypothetical protein
VDPIASLPHRWRIFPATDVVRRIAMRIDAAAPRFSGLHKRGKLEFERLPERIDDEVEQNRISGQSDRCGQRVGIVAPVGCIQPDAMPREWLAAQKLVQGQVESLDRQTSSFVSR